jgi:hypothetical protein
LLIKSTESSILIRQTKRNRRCVIVSKQYFRPTTYQYPLIVTERIVKKGCQIRSGKKRMTLYK